MLLRDIKTAKITSKGQIAIPKQIRDKEGFKEGSQVAILTYENHVEIRPMEQINEKMYPALMTQKVLEKEWNSKEDDEAWKDL